MKLEQIVNEEMLEEISLRRGLAAGALAASLAAGSHAAQADTTLTQRDANTNTSTTMHISGENSNEYNQKMFPVYQQMLKDFMDAHAGVDLSFARDIVRGRWTAKYHSQVPQPPQPPQG